MIKLLLILLFGVNTFAFIINQCGKYDAIGVIEKGTNNSLNLV